MERINQKRLKDIQLEKRGNGKMKGTRRGGVGRVGERQSGGEKQRTK